MAVGASNRLPEDDALGALFDRFLIRVRCDNVAAERMQELLASGWKLNIGAHAAGAELQDRGRAPAACDARRSRSGRSAAGLRRDDPPPAACRHSGFRLAPVVAAAGGGHVGTGRGALLG